MERTALQDLNAVLAIARHGSFRAAALDLDVSTTALSHAIRKLEANLGVRLFNRTTRSLALTEAGSVFLARAAPALQDIHDALQAVRAHRNTPAGTLRINAAPFAAREIMSPLVLEFLRRYPDMHVDLVTEGRLIDIVQAGFDLGVRVASLVPSDMIAVPLGNPQRYAVVGSRAYLEHNPLPRVPADLMTHACVRVRLPDGGLFKWRFEADGQEVQIDVCGRITLDEARLARIVVMEGMGLGYFMEQDVRADIEAGHLVRLLEDWTPAYPGLCLYYSGRRGLSAGMQAFLDLARELAAATLCSCK